jgi:hypothetical protein
MAGRHLAALIVLATAVWATSFATMSAVRAPAAFQRPPAAAAAHPAPDDLFESSDVCLACHNGLVSPAGEDVSIGADWRTSMMANSSRDPYWMAAVRREVMDHPQAREAIEDECSICHMPTSTFTARAGGSRGQLFARLAPDVQHEPDVALARDGVTCTVCHQMSASRLGDPATFTGGYVIDVQNRGTDRRIFGPFAIDQGRTRVMQSASGFTPGESGHIQQAEVCASCHTLFTHALVEGAENRGRLPEQAPYLEWQQSAYRTTASCQRCHMPEVEGETAVSAVLGQARPGVSRHAFLGGNFFMMRMLNRYRDELGVRATSREMETAITRTLAHLRADTARVSVARAARAGNRLGIDVDVENLAGHKFPTAYPSRRAWLHVLVADGTGRTVFESGRFTAAGRIDGNDNDADATTFEPHYTRIDRADQVQIYESVMVDPRDRVTTGLLTGVRYVKDNRLLPRGFDKTRVPADVAVHGDAVTDADFIASRDRVHYDIPLGDANGPLTVTVRLWFQPIGFRWAENFRGYDAPEPRRFVRYWDAMAASSATVVADAVATVP